MKKSIIILFVILFAFLICMVDLSYAFWIWTPKTKTMINPKLVVKDSPGEQFEWAMRFFKESDFKRAADEFIRLTKYYPDSDLAPEAQYYAGRAFEELGKYYFAFQNYQKTVENYPYTERMQEIISREYNIANIFQSKESPKLMDMELSLSLDRAIVIYGKIVENTPFGKFTDKSLYKMAECYRRLKKHSEAIDAYERIINDYPESNLVPEARYQAAYTKYEASLDPEYDQESTEGALEDFKNISRTTPIPSIADEAEKVLDELRERKAQSAMRTAEFYERQNKYRSALIYYKEVTGKFPGTEAAGLAQEKIEQLEQKIKL